MKEYRIYERLGESWKEYADIKIEENRIVLSDDSFTKGVGFGDPTYELYIQNTQITNFISCLRNLFPNETLELNENQQKQYDSIQDNDIKELYQLLILYYKSKKPNSDFHNDTKDLTAFCKENSIEYEEYEDAHNWDWGFDYGEDD